MLSGHAFGSSCRSTPSMNRSENDEEIARIRARLASLKAERAELEVTLGELERQRTAFARSDDRPALVANPPSALYSAAGTLRTRNTNVVIRLGAAGSGETGRGAMT